MKIGDLIVFFPAAIATTIAKTIRTNILDDTKEYIENNHLYHCVTNKEIADKIIDSNYLKPATGLLKNINSYGKAAACMFAGIPTMDSFVKNMSINPYIEPQRITHAIEVDIKKEEIDKNYKIRPFSDEAILYEGYCVLPKDRTKIVEFVADLKRDEKGNAIIDEKTKMPIGIELRKRTEDEIKESPDEYIPKEDYLTYIKERKKQIGYLEGKNFIEEGYNYVSNIVAGGKLEYNEIVRSTKHNFIPTIKSIIDKFKGTKKLKENSEMKIDRLTNGKEYLIRKNPYADKKFSLAIARISKGRIKSI